MKTKSIAALLAMLITAGLAQAQATGTININGNNPAAVSITDTSNGSLTTTVALGTLTPATGGTLTPDSFTIRVRSSKAYILSAQATALAFTGAGLADGGSSISAADIGFGITTLVNTGVNVANSGSRTDTIVPKFSYTSGFPAVVNGLTPFVPGTNGTLDDLSANTQILSGGRISSRGNISTSNNFIQATLGVATLPQYFTPNTSFSATITLTVTAP